MCVVAKKDLTKLFYSVLFCLRHTAATVRKKVVTKVWELTLDDMIKIFR